MSATHGDWSPRARQGRRFRRRVTVVGVDLTGYDITMQVRTIEGGSLIADLSIGSGIEFVDAEEGIFLIEAGGTDTAGWRVGEWVHELVLLPSADADQAFALTAGPFTVENRVTL